VLRFNRGLSQVHETNMLEEKSQPVPFTGSTVPLDFKPFEIKTLLIHL
jgi:alpha-mannosidase